MLKHIPYKAYTMDCAVDTGVNPNRDGMFSLQWSHNGRDGFSNYQPHHCLPNRLFRRRSKKTSKPRVAGFCVGIHRWPVNSPHKWPVARKVFPYAVGMHFRFSIHVTDKCVCMHIEKVSVKICHTNKNRSCCVWFSPSWHSPFHACIS